MRTAVPLCVLIALTHIAASGCGNVAAPDPEPTPIRLDQPQRRAVIQETSNQETLHLLGESFQQTIDEDLRYTMDIQPSGTDSDATFTTTIDFFSLNMESDLMEDAMPGRMDPTTMMIRPVNEVLRAATELSYSGTLASDGNVYNLAGLDELKQTVHEKLKSRRLPVELMGTTVMDDVVEEIFNEETVTLTLEQILLPRPLEPLIEGTTWSGTTQINFGVTELPAEVQFTVGSVTPERIEVKESVTFAIDSEGVQALRESLSPNDPFDAEVSGTGSGTYQVDPASGWVTHYKQVLSLSGRYDFNGGILAFNNYITRTFETFAD